MSAGMHSCTHLKQTLDSINHNSAFCPNLVAMASSLKEHWPPNTCLSRSLGKLLSVALGDLQTFPAESKSTRGAIAYSKGKATVIANRV